MNDLAEAEPSLRDEIAAAIEAEAPAAETAPAEPPAAPERDDHGRFSAPETTETPSETDPPAGGGEPPTAETVAPPASWSAAAKARFQALDPVIQQEVLKREKDMDAGKAQWDQKGERLNRLETILAPRRERMQLAGLDDARAIEALFAAQDYLERDPAGGLAWLARQYGVDLNRLRQGQPEQAAQPPMHPAVARLAEQVGAMQGALAEQQRAAEQAQRARADAELQAFRADPSNLYFDNARDDMAALLKTGRAATLKDAYDRAVWANPETRTLVIAHEEDQRRSAAEQAARERTQAARHAAGSITGPPQPGASPMNAGPAPSLRDELARAFADAS
jgi:hypothetical protein